MRKFLPAALLLLAICGFLIWQTAANPVSGTLVEEESTALMPTTMILWSPDATMTSPAIGQSGGTAYEYAVCGQNLIQDETGIVFAAITTWQYGNGTESIWVSSVFPYYDYEVVINPTEESGGTAYNDAQLVTTSDNSWLTVTSDNNCSSPSTSGSSNYEMAIITAGVSEVAPSTEIGTTSHANFL